MNVTPEEKSLILISLEEKRIEYQHFYQQARKAGNIDFMEKWSKMESKYQDLILKITLEDLT